jgi:hypothetical protein
MLDDLDRELGGAGTVSSATPTMVCRETLKEVSM